VVEASAPPWGVSVVLTLEEVVDEEAPGPSSWTESVVEVLLEVVSLEAGSLVPGVEMAVVAASVLGGVVVIVTVTVFSMTCWWTTTVSTVLAGRGDASE
jgi:hypothetical protein